MALGCAAWLPPPPPLQLRWSACAEPVEAGRPEPCEGAFQCGIRHVSPDVLSAPEPQRGRVWKGFALPGAFYHFLWRRPEHSRGHGGTAEVWNWWSRVEWEGGGESGVPRAPARRRAGRPQHRLGDGETGVPHPPPRRQGWKGYTLSNAPAGQGVRLRAIPGVKCPAHRPAAGRSPGPAGPGPARSPPAAALAAPLALPGPRRLTAPPGGAG